jgi:hypothetical protein
MFALPRAAEPLLLSLSIAFRPATFNRFLALLIGAVVVRGRRTVTSLYWAVRRLVPGHFSDFHRVFSRAVWSLWPLARVLAAAVVRLVPAGEPLRIAVDETICRRQGRRVYGQACHRDPLKSSRTYTSYVWGHKWVVVSILVALPLISRPWALPVLVAMFRTPRQDQQEGRRHKTPSHLAGQLVLVLRRWFPQRRFLVVGDGEYASRALGTTLSRRNAVLVSVFHDDARLYAPLESRPCGQRKRGRPHTIGARLPNPGQVVQDSKARIATVAWYGGSTRRVALVTGAGLWRKNSRVSIHVRWVCVRDPRQRGKPLYLFSSDASMTPEQIVELYVTRWSLEVTFQESKAHLGLETPRQRVCASVLRTTPCLLGLYTVIALIYAAHVRATRHDPAESGRRPWYHKPEPTFSDALREVRGLFWSETLITHGHKPRQRRKPLKLSPRMLLSYLSDAA